MSHLSYPLGQRPPAGRAMRPYLWSLAAVAVAVAVRALLAPLLGPALPFITLFPAVFLVAYFWGLGPTLVGTLTGLLAAFYAFFDPPFTFAAGGSVASIGVALFAVSGIATGWLGEARLQASRLALRQAQENECLREVAEDAAAEAEMAAQQAADALAQQLEAEKALRQSETELTDFFANASAAMNWVGPDGTILRVNQAELDMLGYRHEEYVGRHIAEFHVDRQVIDDILRRLIEGEVIRQRPARLRRKDGRIMEVLIDSSAYRVDGRFVHTRCFTRDVTGEREAQDAVSRLAAIVSSSSDAIVGKTLDGTVTSWNAAAERIFGWDASEMVGQSVYRLIPDELRDAERDILQRLRRGEAVAFSEAERVRKDGTRIWISLGISPIRDASGTVVGAASIKRDITERKRAEAEVRQNQEQLRLAHQAARMGTWRWDIARNELRWDEGLHRLYGLQPGEQVSGYDDFIARVHPDDRERVGTQVQEALAGSGTLDYEFRIVLPDGRVRWLADLGRVTTDSAGKPLYLAGICIDVTERKAVEEHLRDTQQLQAVGQLAGGMAHETNNQMTVVLGAAQFLLRRQDLGPAAREEVEYIRHAAERTASITRQLLAFSRRQLMQLQDVDLNRVVESLEPVLRRSLAENHELVVRLGLLEGPVRADLRQLEQVLLNLTFNARDAMPDGGRLTIETGSAILTAEDAGGDRGGPPPGSYALIVVQDSGHGMDPGTLQRAFEPFFTTKAFGQGTGLGLSVVHGIVNQTGGYIRVNSQAGKGTTFRLYLPISPAGRGVDTASGAGSAPANHGRVALVVEDDALVRTMAIRALAEAGYATLEADDGRAALDLIRGHPGRLDVVITDVGMPELDGNELARCLQDERPELPVVFMSGYGDTNPSGPFLQKPFAPDELVARVEEVLAIGAG